MVSLARAQRLAGRGKLDAAEAYLRSALVDGANVRNWLVLGRLLEQGGRAENALHVFDDARVRYPNQAPAHLFYGIAALDLGYVEDAAASFARVLEMQPGNDVARSYAALGKLMQGDDDAAVSTFRTFGISDNRAFRVRLTEWMESQWLANGRFFAQHALEFPSDPPAKTSTRRAQKHFYAKRYAEMLRELEPAALASHPDQSVLFACALGSEMLFDYQRSLEYISRVTEPESEWPDAILATRARSLLRLGDFPAAAADLARVLTVGPEDFGSNYYLGVLCLAHGEHASARQLFMRAHTQYLVDTLDFQYWQMEQALLGRADKL
ncbi:MAG: tetratricopeptide repeat protein [Candidatus Sumerlaeaceae bacterium]